jgi:hypothetical protein
MPYGGMPFHLEKGPTFSVIEDWVKQAGWQGVLKYLEDLRAGLPTTEAGLDSPSLNAGPTPTYAERVAHVEHDWFGWVDDYPTKGQKSQPDFDPVTHSETGFWHNYYGQVEKIWRATLIRACEVVLGLDHGQKWPETKETPRFWPISFYWRCPNPWFETWITWAKYGEGTTEGQVIVHIHTPGHGSPVLTSPLSPPNRSGPNFPEYVLEPTSANSAYGMWVTMETDHNLHTNCVVPVRPPEIAKHRMTDREKLIWSVTHSHVGTGLGRIMASTFGPVYEGVGDVVTVQPCEADGGVRPQGLPY